VATGQAAGHDIIITGARNGTIRTWDAATCEPAGPALTGHNGPVTAVANGRAGNRDVIISGDMAGTVLVAEYRPR
jgi:WD40 repeat protein